MAWNDVWAGLNDTLTTGVNAYTSILKAKSEGKAEAQYYKGMNDALVYSQNQENERGTVQLGNLSISTNSILWIIGGTLGLLAVGIGIKKLI